MRKVNKLTDLQEAIICTLHQVPDYRMIGSERQACERMVKRGYLRFIKKTGLYRPTAAGEKVYAKTRKIRIDQAYR